MRTPELVASATGKVLSTDSSSERGYTANPKKPRVQTATVTSPFESSYRVTCKQHNT